MSRVKVRLQNPTGVEEHPRRGELRRWAKAALGPRRRRSILVIRIVDEAEGAELNRRYRQGTGPTNVLSFPWEAPPGRRSQYLGDLVICESLLRREALAQGTSLQAHWAHLVVHGVLHLLGMDHQSDLEATEMEAQEGRILTGLGFADPYASSRLDAEDPGGAHHPAG